MDRPTDELLQRMLAAVVGAFGDDQQVDRLVRSARAEAEAEIKDLLKSAVKATLLQRAVARLESTRSEPESEPASESESEPASASTPAPDDASESDAETGCYVYGILRAGGRALPPGLVGVDGRGPIRTLTNGQVRAVTSVVSLTDFAPEALGERAKDLEWVGQKVRAHDHVVKSLMAAGTVIPCRFCTILRSEDDVRRVLARHERPLSETLDGLEGRKEWGVKITASAAPAAPAGAADAEGAGRAYFLQKQRDERARGEAARVARAAADECHRELSALASATALLKTHDRGAGAGAGRRDDKEVLLVNGAYLVPDIDAPRFHRLVSDLARRFEPRGLSLELTGPWPPYNFVSLDLSLDAQPHPQEGAAA